MGTQGTVANYLRAMRAIEEFGDDTLAQLAEEGCLPLLHTLHLIPLMRDHADVAREYLAAGNLFDSEGSVRTATAIKADVDRLLKGLRRDEGEEVEEAEGDIALDGVDLQDVPKLGLPIRAGAEYHEPGLDEEEEIEEAPCLAETEHGEPQATEADESESGEEAEDVEDWLNRVAAGGSDRVRDATYQYLRQFAFSLKSGGQCLVEAKAAATTDADAAILAHLERLFNTATGSLSKMAGGLLEGGLDDVRARLEKLPPALHGQQLPRMMTELLRAQPAPASEGPRDTRERAA